MKKILIILFLVSGNMLLSATKEDTTQTEQNQRIFLKTSCRAFFLQPSFSAEYFFIPNLSLNTGFTYFWTGRMIYGDDLGDRMSYWMFNTGPSKGYDVFADINYTFENGTYLGLGYMYRDSHFNNKKLSIELSEYEYQYYYQTEAAQTNAIRITVGNNFRIKNSNFYLNPYLSNIIGFSNGSVKIDTAGQTNYTYKPTEMPINKTFTCKKWFFEAGLNICFKPQTKARRSKKIGRKKSKK